MTTKASAHININPYWINDTAAVCNNQVHLAIQVMQSLATIIYLFQVGAIYGKKMHRMMQ